MARKQAKKNKSSKSFLQYTGMSLQMIGTIVIFLLIGRFLDSKALLSLPIFTLTFMLTGVFVSMYQFIRKL
ncbi:MAG: AtpZ/AtpI family protein [Bacteroidia bacterium]|nr:AtpZ/AtpI family protein [Bacteroidia bacterium]